MFITKSSSISHQNSFLKEGFSASIVKIDKESELIAPKYKEHITSGQLRRMSPVLRSAIACSLQCKETKEWDAIIVATGIGCIKDTHKFLLDINIAKTDSLIPPTAFIQSTHNTISGQISILTKNHNYNITHSHRFFSFENALLDAEQQFLDNKENVLVGASEETIPLFDGIAAAFKMSADFFTTTSSAYFNLSSTTSEIKIDKLIVQYNVGVLNELNVTKLCETNNLDLTSFDLIIDASVHGIALENNSEMESKLLRSKDYYGVNMSLSALALSYAFDLLQSKKLLSIAIVNGYGKNISIISVVNVEA